MKTKKFALCMLIVAMFIGTSTTALANEEPKNDTQASILETVHTEMIYSINGKYSNELTFKTLYDLKGNSFELIETGQTGYYIFDAASGKYLE